MAAALIGTWTAQEGTGVLTLPARTSTAGSLITVTRAVWGGSNAGDDLTAPTDTFTNTYTELQEIGVGASEDSNIALSYNAGGTRGGSHEITATVGVADNRTMAAQEWSGVETTPTVVSNTGTGTDAVPTDSIAVGAASLVVLLITYDSSATTISVGDGTQAQEVDENNDFQAHAVHYKVGQTGTPSITAALGASRTWGVIIAAFTEGAAGSASASISASVSASASRSISASPSASVSASASPTPSASVSPTPSSSVSRSASPSSAPPAFIERTVIDFLVE